MALYVGGKRVKDRNYQRDNFSGEGYEQARGSGGIGANFSNNNSGSSSGDNNKNRGYITKKDDDEKKNFIERFFNKGKADNVITGDDFGSDLKKASKYLYTQHPYAKELMAKYNLTSGDIIDLRMGMTQRGFGDKIRGVYDTKVKPGLMQSNSTYGTDYAMQFFKEGMKPSDYINDDLNPITASMSRMPFLKGVNALFGSPMGQRGLFDGRARGLEGDDLQDYAAAIANNPNLYEQMMATPRMQDYDFNEFIYGVRRDLPPPRGGIESLPAAEPGFDFITDNPYLN